MVKKTLSSQSLGKNQSSFLVIGIDFGTTYSGVSWCWSEKPDDVTKVTDWQTTLNSNRDSAKAPTEIYYGDNTSAGISGDSKGPLWGYNVPASPEVLKWFKLLLVDEGDLPNDVRNSQRLLDARRLVKSVGKTAVEVAADYLRLLWKHAINSITKVLGSKATVDGFPFRVVLTVPAIWNVSAMNRTREAAVKAGILEKRFCADTVLDLVPEPEAAALASLADLDNRPDVQPGDVYVVCDAGGGTADLTSYVVDTVDPFTVSECVGGKGKLCGAMLVDHAFENYVKLRLSPRNWEGISPTSLKRFMNNEWEHGLKRNFDGTDKTWSVQIPLEGLTSTVSGGKKLDDKKRDIKNGEMLITMKNVEAFFQISVAQIQNLISEQIDLVRRKNKKPPKGILLCGGFGSCDYLHLQLMKKYESDGIAVHQSKGDRPWTAISRGALIKGLSMDESTAANIPVRVNKRKTRINLGISFKEVYKEGVHKPEDKEWDRLEGKYMATKQMKWYLRKYSDVTDQKPVKHSWTLRYEKLPQDSIDEIQIYQCDADDASSRMTPDVKELCIISMRINTPFEKLPLYKTDEGVVSRTFPFELHMTWNGTTMDWTVHARGEELGKQDTTVLFSD